jgi:hypothetical protein
VAALLLIMISDLLSLFAEFGTRLPSLLILLTPVSPENARTGCKKEAELLL